MDKNCISRLTNGVMVYNLCSPYPFTFDDGTVVAAQSAEAANRLKAREETYEAPMPGGPKGVMVQTLTLELTAAIEDALDAAQEWADQYPVSSAVILVPYPYLLSRDFSRSRWPSAFAQSLLLGRPQPGEFPPAWCNVFRQEP